MLSLYRDPHFTFRFVDDRIVPRFHLEGVRPGTRVSMYRIDPATPERLGLIATAIVGDDGWVDLAEPIIVRAGSGFVVVPVADSDELPSRARGDDMELTRNSIVRIRNVEQADLPQMYEFQLDPESNQLAVTIPRNVDAFAAHWNTILRDLNVIAKAIVVGEVLAGSISCFKLDGLDSVGYWIAKDFWGKGIAMRALELLLDAVAIRPLHARVATSNVASIRVLQKCGFVVERVQVSPADDRFPECEEAVLVLR